MRSEIGKGEGREVAVWKGTHPGSQNRRDSEKGAQGSAPTARIVEGAFVARPRVGGAGQTELRVSRLTQASTELRMKQVFSGSCLVLM